MPCTNGTYQLYVQHCSDGVWSEPYYMNRDDLFPPNPPLGLVEPKPPVPCGLLGRIGYWIGRGIADGLRACEGGCVGLTLSSLPPTV